jgi:hypothetical protein
MRNVSITEEHFTGPLPHPETLRAYNEIHPGAAKLILDRFEAQSDHRTVFGGVCAAVVVYLKGRTARATELETKRAGQELPG